jgi:hypothetical protein
MGMSQEREPGDPNGGQEDKAAITVTVISIGIVVLITLFVIGLLFLFDWLESPRRLPAPPPPAK